MKTQDYLRSGKGKSKLSHMPDIYASFTPFVILQIFTAIVLGFLVGLERELAGKDPSLRTFTLVCLGACVYSILSHDEAFFGTRGDPTRIAAQIVSGIGFIGAGVIFHLKNKVSGLTTAALLWFMASIGMLIGFGKIMLAIFVTLLTILVMQLFNKIHQILRIMRPHVYQDETKPPRL